MSARNRRSGFTLPEVLVTVAIIAVMAAVVVPTVVQNVNKGNAPSFMSDIKGLQTAVTSFASDVRQFAARIDEMTGSAITTSQKDVFGNAFTATDSGNYHGPYLSTGQTPSATSGYAMSGYPSIVFMDSLVRPGAANACGGLPTSGFVELKDTSTASLPNYGTLAAIDSAVDGPQANPASTGGLRFFGHAGASTPTTAVDSAIYCLITVTH